MSSEYPRDPRCKALDEAVQQHLNQRNLQQAAIKCSDLCSAFPKFAPGWHKGSIVAAIAGSATKAFEYIERAISLDPNALHFYVQKAQLLFDQQNRIEAETLAAEISAKCTPDNTVVLSALAVLYSSLEDHQAALDCYSQVARLEPNNAVNYFNLAATHRFLGNLKEAEESYDMGLKIDPAYDEAYLIRSSLRRQTKEDNHIAVVQERLSVSDKTTPGEVHLCYALAKEYEDIGNFEDSFSALKRGADSQRASLAHDNYKIEQDTDTIDRIIETYSAKFFANAATGHNDNGPLFVFGLPRSGTTLVERILGSHSKVYAAGELNILATEIAQFVQSSTNKYGAKVDLVKASANIDCAELGRRYCEKARLRAANQDRFVDKTPLNYLHCGLLALSLPNAKLIEVQRHPLAACYAIYKQLFKRAYPWSYDLRELGQYYLAQRRLMSHWHAVMPGRIYTIQYEDLVLNQQEETGNLLRSCDLSWEDDCLKFDENRQASLTASAAQIRKPLYQSSLQQWKSYEKQLLPLIEQLVEAGIDIKTA